MKKPTPSRISKAATGKILAGIITSAKESGMDAASFRTLMIAAYEYIESGSTDMSNLPMEWEEVKTSIDKAAIRSAKARERAARKREESAAPTTTSDHWSPSGFMLDRKNALRISKSRHGAIYRIDDYNSGMITGECRSRQPGSSPYRL